MCYRTRATRRIEMTASTSTYTTYVPDCVRIIYVPALYAYMFPQAGSVYLFIYTYIYLFFSLSFYFSLSFRSFSPLFSFFVFLPLHVGTLCGIARMPACMNIDCNPRNSRVPIVIRAFCRLILQCNILA